MRKRGLESMGLFALLILDVFAIIAVLMFLVTRIAIFSINNGWLTTESWNNPLALTLLVVLMSIALTAAVSIIVKHVILRPLQDMLYAMGELRDGNFETRVRSGRALKIREVEDFTDSFNATAEALGQTEILRHDFINDFSHEFKTPIVSINGFAELLCEPDLTERERVEYAEVIAKESKRLVELSSSILALRQAESLDNLQGIDNGPVRIDEQLRSALLVVREKWSDKQLAFDVSLVESTITGNAALLNQVWINLLDNACKFSPVNGLIRVNSTIVGSEVIVRIENDGPSIAPDELDRIFDRFYQSDPSHATLGCGLGLPLVRRILDLHHATVNASSQDGHTIFTVILTV